MSRTYPAPDWNRALPYNRQTWKNPHTLRNLGGGYWLYLYTSADFTTGPDAPRPVRATLGFAADPDADAPDHVGTLRQFDDLTAPQVVALMRRYRWIAEAMEAETGAPVHPLDIPAAATRYADGRLSWSALVARCPHPGLG